MRTVITGTGMSVPDTVVTNYDLSLIVDTDDEWISSRTGVATQAGGSRRGFIRSRRDRRTGRSLILGGF